MTDCNRRSFLILAAGSSFTFLTLGAASAHGVLDQDKGKKGGDGKDGKDKDKDKGKTESKPASKPAENKSKEIEAGDQTDGSYVLDPDNPPKLDIKTKESTGGSFIKVGKETVLVAQSADKKHWYAVGALCPHQGTAVVWKADDACFRCPKHGSKFTIAGKVTKGPAKEDLTEFKAEEVKGKGNKKFVKVSKK